MAAALCLLAADGLTQPAITLKFSHVVAPGTPKGKGAARFKELAERYTNGRVQVEIFPNSQLYTDRDEIEALQLGAVQMLAPSLAKFGPIGAREFEVFDLPFILPGKAALRKVTDGPLGRRLFSLLEPKSIVGLAYWDNGFKVMSANRPLREPADFRGLKMRVQSSTVLEAQFRALGAVPQALSFSDVYGAMLSGAVDGSENTPSNMFTQHHHEVQRFLTLSDHGYLGYAVIANKRFWDGLPGDVRRQLSQALAEATDYANRIAQAENDEALAGMRRSGRITLVTLTAEQKAAWRKALAPVYAEMAARVGRETLEEFLREAAGAPN